MALRIPFRTKVLVVVLSAGVLPLTVTGVWLAAAAERSGEVHLRARLDESLVRTAQDIGARWVAIRSQLLALSQSADMACGAAPSAGGWVGGKPPPESIDLPVFEHVTALSLQDLDGRSCWTWQEPRRGQPASTIAVRLNTFDNVGGGQGALQVQLKVLTLLSRDLHATLGLGSVIALIDRQSGALLMPLPFDPRLVVNRRFSWASEEWLASTLSLDEPRLDIVATAPLTPYLAPFRQTTRRGLIALALVSAVACVFALLLAHRTTRSLARLSAAAAAVSQGQFDRGVDVVGHDEIAALATAFNRMTQNLRQTLAELTRRESVAAVGEFASSLAHEVRNPLTSIRIDLQRIEERMETGSALHEPISRALQSVTRLDASVTGALRVARSGRLTMGLVNLQSVLDAAAAETEPEATARHVALSRRYPDEAQELQGDQAALHQLFLNLLLNAVQAVDRGGCVEVSIERQGAQIVTRVADNGPGIPLELRQQVLEPFYSTKPSGTGLGLAIATRIALAHGGSLDIDSSPTAGTVVVVRLPA